jgi:hypothetical protein
MAGNVNKRVTVQASMGTNARPYLKNYQNKKGWGHDSSDRARA